MIQVNFKVRERFINMQFCICRVVFIKISGYWTIIRSAINESNTDVRSGEQR
jgi:hypothetical protein